MKSHSYILIIYYTKLYLIINIIERDRKNNYYWWNEINAEGKPWLKWRKKNDREESFGVSQRIIFSDQACVLCDNISFIILDFNLSVKRLLMRKIKFGFYVKLNSNLAVMNRRQDS
jgi:hypothetical protein